MFRNLCVLFMLAITTQGWSLTPEQLEFNDINAVKDQNIAAQRYDELAEQSIEHANLLLELAARSTTNRIYILNNQKKYIESSEVSKEAIAQFEQHNDSHIRAVVASLLLNQSSALKKLGQSEEHLQLLKRVTDDYQYDKNPTTQTLVAMALLAQVDAHLLAEDDLQARKEFEVFDTSYIRSGLYKSLNPESVITVKCDIKDPCQPFATGEHDLNPRFFSDRATWYRNRFNNSK